MTASVATTPEIVAYADPIIEAIGRIFACLDGQDAEELNWRPPAKETNSLYVLAVHTLANAEEFILGFLDGQPIVRDRDAEFAASGDSAAPLQARWNELQANVREALGRLGPDVLTNSYTHPRRGTRNGRAVLIGVAQHAAEHAGHAELTRDLLAATRM